MQYRYLSTGETRSFTDESGTWRVTVADGRLCIDNVVPGSLTGFSGTINVDWKRKPMKHKYSTGTGKFRYGVRDSKFVFDEDLTGSGDWQNITKIT